MTAAIQSLDRTRLVDFSQLSHREYSAEKGITALLLMPSNLEITQAGDRLREESVSPTETVLDVAPPVVDAPARLDETGVELKRGAFLNTIAMLASNFRGIFTFLVARLLGPAALGIFSVAWSTTDIISKIGVLGLDNA
ncbi:MAG: hypothetical protein DMF22_03005, partial [Verrucomicrobia bacterium]